ncbi:allophanate hydrolase [Cellulomonas xiejunii]|uniref:Allophanate hydrolase n=1 Tax=Cellulomonas xiejunii TaxID=2968083 RepID=A0ABY5KQ30_9CELL|nr:allophanate hydrolase [Cellulomonas xiejunii]MCC2322561.1 allophanate hydrolase [Cellulomonas xiejunii]UUI72597.1 allophanate hydrolase [Cellulomonas xiejunii]
MTALGPDAAGACTATAQARVRAAHARLREVDRPEVWTLLLPEADALATARRVDQRVAAGEHLPLAGTTLAVKDNVDVAGLPTTAGCPSYATDPRGRPGPAPRTAPAVQALLEAGTVLLGKTNLDQFATGLVGTRSPYGAVRHATRPDRVSGGSSSGSAVAVALGVADIGIGTDTAGSGRVPAAFHGLVGIKTTVGLVPTDGVVPACASYDVVTTLTRDLATGARATRIMVDAGGDRSGRRRWPTDVRLALPEHPVVAVPRAADLDALAPSWRVAFGAAVAHAQAVGARTVEVDVSGMLAAAHLLYEGAILAERYAAVGEFLAGSPPDADPTVAAIVLAGASVPAAAYVRDRAALVTARAQALDVLDGCDLLLLPTTTDHPTLADVAADPVGVNRRLGTYTNFVNLLDLAAVAVPVGAADGGPFGVTVLARAFDDQPALDLAARLLEPMTGDGTPVRPGTAAPLVVSGSVELLVVGSAVQPAVRRALVDLGGRCERRARTSEAYALRTPGVDEVRSAGARCQRTPAPGEAPTSPPYLHGHALTRVAPGAGASFAGEVWRLSAAALGTLLASLPAPAALGPVELADGSWVVGWSCTARTPADAGRGAGPGRPAVLAAQGTR